MAIEVSRLSREETRPLSIQACPPWHLPWVARLHRRCFRIGYDWSVLLHHWLCYPQGYRLAWIGKEPVAFCIARPMWVPRHGRVGEIVAIGVVPEARRQGIARCLLEEALERFRRMGLREAHLQVRVSNWAARRLYHSLGFQEAKRLPAYYADAEDGLLMIRPL